MAATYTAADIQRQSTRAHEASPYRIRLKATKNAFIFLATSADTGELAYRVAVTPGETLYAAECSCEAGRRGIQCKHGGAAISAVQHRTVREAAKIMARRSIEVRQLRKLAAAS